MTERSTPQTSRATTPATSGPTDTDGNRSNRTGTTAITSGTDHSGELGLPSPPRETVVPTVVDVAVHGDVRVHRERIEQRGKTTIRHMFDTRDIFVTFIDNDGEILLDCMVQHDSAVCFTAWVSRPCTVVVTG